MRITDTWLLPRGVDRERMLDMDARLEPIRRRTFVVLGAGLVACAPWIGVWPIVPLLVAAVVFWAARRIVRESSNPGIPMFAAWASAQAIIAASVALTPAGVRQSTVCWLAIPISTLSARFSTRGIWAGVSLSLALMAAVVLSADPSAVLRQPPILFAPAAVVIATAMLSTALMRSDIDHRRETLIDPLTGMLNRNALRRRIEELSQQSEVSGAPVGVIVADVDGFKGVNDSGGHAVGDAVLKDLAYEIRKRLRAFDFAYRLGGDEFLILMPGADVFQSRRQAEELRQALAEVAIGGQRVTMSFGVAASLQSAGFDYESVASQADAALYEAKRSGRNRVCTGARPFARAVVAERDHGPADSPTADVAADRLRENHRAAPGASAQTALR